MRETIVPWRPLQAINAAMADGENWFFAWGELSRTAYRHLARSTGISDKRLAEIGQEWPVTRDELEKLAKAWGADVADIIMTLPANTLVE